LNAMLFYLVIIVINRFVLFISSSVYLFIVVTKVPFNFAS